MQLSTSSAWLFAVPQNLILHPLGHPVNFGAYSTEAPFSLEGLVRFESSVFRRRTRI